MAEDPLPELLARSPAALRWVCEQLADADRIALDTEFFRDHLYSPEVCLLQVASDGLIALLDPQQVGDLEPFAALLADPARTWVLHAAKGDLEVLDCTGLPLPARLFDTQLAAGFCGWPHHVSYANLVEDLCGVALAKGATRTDWRRRPLRPKQLRYAVDDVRFLLPMARVLEARLDAGGWAECLAEECERLLDPKLWRVEAPDAWRKVKAWRSLRGRSLVRLQELARAREELAQQLDRPVPWLGDDRRLVGWAQGGNGLDEARFPQLSGAEAGRVRRGLQAALDGAPAIAQPRFAARKRRLQPAERDRADRLAKVLREAASAQGIASELVITKRVAKEMVRARPQRRRDLASIPGWQGWRQRRFGEHAWEALRES